jgi:hypothetical protein
MDSDAFHVAAKSSFKNEVAFLRTACIAPHFALAHECSRPFHGDSDSRRFTGGTL